MSDIIVRDIEENDLPVLKALIAEAFGEGWNLGRFAENKGFLSSLLSIYLSMFLEPSTFGKVAEAEGEVVGAVLCSVGGEATTLRRLLKDIMPNTLALLAAPEAERFDIVEHISVSFQTIGKLLEGNVDAYDGSLEFIAVSAQARGLGIGKTLWSEACGYFNSKNTESIYLITDSACNIGFYEHSGFSRVGAERAVYNYTTGQRQSEVYVYEYRFDTQIAMKQ